MRFAIDPADPDGETDQTAYLFHEESYTLTYSSTNSGHALTQYDLIFFIPSTASTCPTGGFPGVTGGYLDANFQVTVQLSAAQSHYVLCLREGLDGSAPVVMHRHITAVVAYRSPSPPPSPPPDRKSVV